MTFTQKGLRPVFCCCLKRSERRVFEAVSTCICFVTINEKVILVVGVVYYSLDQILLWPMVIFFYKADTDVML